MATEGEKPGDALDVRCGGFFAEGGETHVGHWESCTLGSGWLRSGVRPLLDGREHEWRSGYLLQGNLQMEDGGGDVAKAVPENDCTRTSRNLGGDGLPNQAACARISLHFLVEVDCCRQHDSASDGGAVRIRQECTDLEQSARASFRQCWRMVRVDPVTAADSRTTRHSDLEGLAALEQVFSGSLKRVGPAAEGMRSELE